MPGPITFACSPELYLGWPELVHMLGATIKQRIPEMPEQSEGWFETAAERIVVRRGDEQMQFLTYIVTNSDHPNGDPCIEPDFTLSESWLGENVFRCFLASGLTASKAFHFWYCRLLFRSNAPYLVGGNPFGLLLEPIVKLSGAILKPVGLDGWSLDNESARVSLYTGPAMDFPDGRPCSYWAIDYPRRLFGADRSTRYLAEQIAFQFEEAEAIRLLPQV